MMKWDLIVPLVFGTSGWMGADYNCFPKRLAEKLLLYCRFYICNGGKFITLTIFNCKRTAKKILFIVFV